MRSLGMAVALLLAVTARLEALPKGLQWGMSSEDAKAILGTPAKVIKTGKVRDIYYAETDYAGSPFTFRLTFDSKGALVYMSAAAKVDMSADEKTYREAFEKVQLQLSQDVPGVGAAHEEKPDERNPFCLQTMVKTSGVRFCHAFRANGKKYANHFMTIQKLKGPPPK